MALPGVPFIPVAISTRDRIVIPVPENRSKDRFWHLGDAAKITKAMSMTIENETFGASERAGPLDGTGVAVEGLSINLQIRECREKETSTGDIRLFLDQIG